MVIGIMDLMDAIIMDIGMAIGLINIGSGGADSMDSGYLWAAFLFLCLKQYPERSEGSPST